MLHSIHRKFTKLPLQTCYPHKVFSVKKGIVSFCVPTCLLQLATAALRTRFAACPPPPAAKSGEKNPAPADPYPDCRKHPERCRNNMPSRPPALTFGTKTGPQGKVFLNFLCFIVFLLIFAKRFSRYPGNLPARPDLLSRKKQPCVLTGGGNRLILYVGILRTDWPRVARLPGVSVPNFRQPTLLAEESTGRTVLALDDSSGGPAFGHASRVPLFLPLSFAYRQGHTLMAGYLFLQIHPTSLPTKAAPLDSTLHEPRPTHNKTTLLISENLPARKHFLSVKQNMRPVLLTFQK